MLGVPLGASTADIKKHYRKLTKRWHPDLYRAGTQQHLEATTMMKLVNDAYAKIQDAPLRKGYEGSAYAARNNNSMANHRNAKVEPLDGRTIRGIEFWVRFTCGGLFGAFLSFRVILDWSVFLGWIYRPFLLVTLSCVLTIGCAIGAAVWGRRIWDNLKGRS